VPTIYTFTGGLANLNSIAARVNLPSIEGQAVVIERIQVVRGLGRLLTDGDQAFVMLSHRNDILTTDLSDDEDDLLGENDDRDYWWIHGLSETDHATDHLQPPEVVAGPQTLVFVNQSGGTTSVRMNMTYHLERMALTEWTLLKTRTSYEGSL